jgi:hypothetical protein
VLGRVKARTQRFEVGVADRCFAPKARDQVAALGAFVGDGLDVDLGLRAPAGLAQRVQWTQVVQSRRAQDGSRVYTVAAQTDRAGLLCLSVDVARASDGALRLDGHPALVGAPFSEPSALDPDARLREVDDRGLRATCQRALRNFRARAAQLPRARDNLAADLSADAVVALPGLAMTLRR